MLKNNDSNSNDSNSNDSNNDSNSKTGKGKEGGIFPPSFCLKGQLQMKVDLKKDLKEFLYEFYLYDEFDETEEILEIKSQSFFSNSKNNAYKLACNYAREYHYNSFKYLGYRKGNNNG